MTNVGLHVEEDSVAYVMNHYVMGLDDAEGLTSGYLTVYDLGWMPEVGIGSLSLARLRRPGAAPLDLVGAPDPALALRMQQRLRGMFGADDAKPAHAGPSVVPIRQRDPSYDLDLSVPPVAMTLDRLAEPDGSVGWRLATPDMTVEAWWRDVSPPLTVVAPVGALHPQRSVSTVMLSYASVTLEVSGVALDVRPRVHTWWSEQLGHPFSSAHVAVGETVSKVVTP